MLRVPSGRTHRPPGSKKFGRRIGKKLRVRRESLSPIPSAVEVANEAQISVDALRKIERGEVADPGFLTVVRLCRALKLPAAEVEHAVLGRRRR